MRMRKILNRGVGVASKAPLSGLICTVLLRMKQNPTTKSSTNNEDSTRNQEKKISILLNENNLRLMECFIQ
jgi:hypothetical protein